MTKYMKAIFAAITAGLGSAAVALTDGVITPLEWVVLASAVVAAGGAVYGIPNSGGQVITNVPDSDEPKHVA